jgi:hypothetical protein
MFEFKHRADSLEFFFSEEFFRFSRKGQIMLVSLTPGQIAKATVSPTAKGNPSQATLTEISFVSGDPTVFTVIPDPAVPTGCIITGVGSGTALQASITANALATEPNGTTTEQISGSDVVACSLLPPPPPVADGLVFTLTTTTPVPPAVPLTQGS